MPVRKHPFTLLEVSVALFLAAILITLMLRFFTEAHLIEHKLDIANAKVIERAHLYTRLTQIFPGVPTAASELKKVGLYTTKVKGEKADSLVFFYDNGIDPDPKFSGIVLGRLSLIDQELSLLTWPLNEKKHFRKEILMNKVQDLSYQFFTSSEEGFFWTKKWLKESSSLPPMIKISLMQDEEPLDFAFFLPVQMSKISYPSPKNESL